MPSVDVHGTLIQVPFELSDVTTYAKATGIGAVLGGAGWLWMASALSADQGADLVFYGALAGMSFPFGFDVLNWIAGN